MSTGSGPEPRTALSSSAKTCTIDPTSTSLFLPHPKSTMISPQETRPPVIRDPRPADEADWRLLWSGYCKFYETEVPEAVTAATWERMLAPGSPLFGRIAEWDGQVAGFAISVLHEGSWTTRGPAAIWRTSASPPSCADRALPARSSRISSSSAANRAGRDFIGIRAICNHEARRLYDRFATADDFVRYRIPIE